MKLNFEKLVEKEKYQVFLFKSTANFPFVFASHTFFVLNKKGEISRWEVCFSKKYKTKEKFGHLYKNLYLPTQGIEIFPYFKKLFWKSKLLKFVENKDANKMIEIIENSQDNYPYCNRYHLLGPNSNTYTQWIINNSPNNNLKLPWNAFGKNYK